MSSQSELPICTSCNRPILPGERAVRFQCPECGDVVIWRCTKCRQFTRDYKCINCGFSGP